MNTRLTRTCIATFAALLLGSFAAQAADMGQPSYKAPAYSAPIYSNWTGFYLGINGGYAWGSSQWSGPGGSFEVSPNGWLIGGTAGFNLQTGTWVWGVEGDMDYADLNGTLPITTCSGSCSFKDTWLATVRGRLGYGGWDNWLPYITGGVAFGNAKVSSPIGDVSKTQTGWTAGGGLEWAFLPNWSVKLEYLYVDLGSYDCGSACAVSGESIKFTSSILRGGINYRF